MTEVVGYFAYEKHGNGIWPVKFSHERVGMNSEATNYFKQITIREWPLTAEQFKLSLDDLSKAYPCPPQQE